MEKLERGIHRWDLVAVALNGVIGAGIFGLPSKIFALVGPYSLLSFLACALIVSLIVLCFIEVGSRYSETGGPYLYAREAFGSLVGFQVGWLTWLARVTAFAANSNLAVGYLGFFWPAAVAGLPRILLLTSVVAAMTIINVAGVRKSALTGNGFAVGKLIPLGLFIAVGLFFVSPGSYALGAFPGYAAFSTSILLLVYAFTGFEMAFIPAGEVRDVRRNLPGAIMTAMTIVALVYILVQVVCVGTLPELAASERPLADASRRFMGTAGGAVLSAGAIISVMGNLNVVLLAASRLPFAMAEHRELPVMLSRVHPKLRTPHVAILATSAVTLAVTLSGSFIYAATVSAISRLLAYAATTAAVPALRLRPEAPPAGFRLPGGSAIAALVTVLSLWLLSNSTLREGRDSAIAAAAGFAIYIGYRLYSRRGKFSN
jgi:amino acid transporter